MRVILPIYIKQDFPLPKY